jgi:hypothetical protein
MDIRSSAAMVVNLLKYNALPVTAMAKTVPVKIAGKPGYGRASLLARAIFAPFSNGFRKARKQCDFCRPLKSEFTKPLSQAGSSPKTRYVEKVGVSTTA